MTAIHNPTLVFPDFSKVRRQMRAIKHKHVGMFFPDRYLHAIAYGKETRAFTADDIEEFILMIPNFSSVNI